MLAIDELALIMSSLTGTFYSEREKKVFINMIKGFQGRVVLYDQKFTKAMAAELKKIFPDLHIVENVYTPQRVDVYCERSTRAAYESIFWRATMGKVAVYCDTVRQAKKLDKALRREGLAPLLVTAATVDEKTERGEAIQAIEKDPALVDKYQCIIFTPRWQRGVSFEIEEGRHVFAIRRDANQAAGTIAQAIDRFRKPASITLCLVAMKGRRSPSQSLEDFQRQGWRRYEKHIAEICKNTGETPETYTRELSDILHALEYEQKKNLVKSLA